MLPDRLQSTHFMCMWRQFPAGDSLWVSPPTPYLAPLSAFAPLPAPEVCFRPHIPALPLSRTVPVWCPRDTIRAAVGLAPSDHGSLVAHGVHCQENKTKPFSLPLGQGHSQLHESCLQSHESQKTCFCISKYVLNDLSHRDS